MGSALEAVLALRQNEQAQQKAQADSIANAVQLFQSARQTALSNQLAMLQYKAGLAEKGLKQGADGNFTYDPSTMNPLQQILTGTKLQADAKTAGNKAVYDLAGQVLNGAIPGSAQSSIPSGSPVAQAINPSSPSVAINNPIGSAVATTGMTPVSQTSSTDPVTGLTTGTTTMTNIPAKVAESSAEDVGKAQADATVGSARDAAQMQMVAQGLKNLNQIHKSLSDKGFAGNALSQPAAEHYNLLPQALQNKLVPPDTQKDIGKFISARNEALVKVQPILSQQFGQAGSSRIMESLVNLSKGEFGDLSTPHAQFEGQAEGTLGSLYRIKVASDKYLQGLKDAGQPIPTNEKAVTQGIYSNMADLTPAQESDLKSLVSSTLGKTSNSDLQTPSGIKFSYKLKGK